VAQVFIAVKAANNALQSNIWASYFSCY